MKYKVESNLLLIQALKLAFPESSMNTLKSWIKEGRITLDGLPAKNWQLSVLEGQEIELKAKSRFLDNDLRILYEDADLVVIDKPNGLLSVAAAYDKSKTAHAILKAQYKPKQVYVVHRLDQDTSGVMMFALKDSSYNALKKIFEKHDIDRVYYAIVEGKLSSPKGTWQSYLYEDANYHVHSSSQAEAGELAITHYQVKATSKYYSLLELKLETGKKNQIRVHCQQAGHPVVGDKKYGATRNPLNRLGLHAYKLAFEHPGTHRKKVFISPIPEVFQKIFHLV